MSLSSSFHCSPVEEFFFFCIQDVHKTEKAQNVLKTILLHFTFHSKCERNISEVKMGNKNISATSTVYLGVTYDQ